MWKKGFGIILAAFCAVNLSACGIGAEESLAGERADGENRDWESGEIGSETGKADIKNAQEELKAVGYEYDREDLTWELVWSDEFDYEGVPDPEKWGYDVGGGGWGNNELQYYTDGGNATVRDGCLVIEARKETVGAREYTSARLVTREKGDLALRQGGDLRQAARGAWHMACGMDAANRLGIRAVAL